MSQQQLSKLSGVPRSTLAHLESGNGNPSLQTLSQVSGALQVSIEELIAKPRPQIQLVRAKDQKVLQKGQGNVMIMKLLPDPVPGMELDQMTLAPGARMGGIPHVGPTKEYLFCMKGEVRVTVAGITYELRAGDLLAFPGNQNHLYANPGHLPALCMSVVTLVPAGI